MPLQPVTLIVCSLVLCTQLDHIAHEVQLLNRFYRNTIKYPSSFPNRILSQIYEASLFAIQNKVVILSPKKTTNHQQRSACKAFLARQNQRRTSFVWLPPPRSSWSCQLAAELRSDSFPPAACPSESTRVSFPRHVKGTGRTVSDESVLRINGGRTRRWGDVASSACRRFLAEHSQPLAGKEHKGCASSWRLSRGAVTR